MKEFIRMERVSFGEQLDQYCLTVYEGDIIYIQSFSDNSLTAVQQILSGEQKPESGRLFLDEKEIADFQAKEAENAGIFEVTLGKEFADDMTIAENMKEMRPFYSFYSEKKNIERVRNYLWKEGVYLEPSRPVWALQEAERWKLELLRAKLLGARLVMLDLSGIPIEGNSAFEVGELIKKMQKDGMTFLIFSDRYSYLSEIAGRIQYLNQGFDQKEWSCLSAIQKKKMRDGSLFFGGISPAEINREKRMIGLCDYEWNLMEGIWSYLSKIRADSPELWDSVIQADLPEEGEVSNGRTVLIPGNSGDLLLKDLNIGQNLTIAAGKRIAHGEYGLIRKRLEIHLIDDFYRRFQLDPKLTSVKELNKVQRKILSIARWEIARPKVIILEMPYIELNSEEMIVLRKYLYELTEKGIRVIYMSKSIESMHEDCTVILKSVNGKSVKINTI